MFKIVGSSKVSPRFQITLPDEVRKHLKLEIGENVGCLLDEENNKIYLMTQVGN